MNRASSHNLPGDRRGLVLVMVLVVMLFAIWTASLLVSSAQVQAGAASFAEQQARSHAVLRSGIDVIVQTLANQRAAILTGNQVEIDEEYVIYKTDTHYGMVKLLPVTPDGDHVRNEATCLDINHVTSEQLLATGLVEPEVAQAIVNRRKSAGPFGSISELLMVDGMTPVCLYGDVAELDYTSQARGEPRGLGDRILDRLGLPEPRGLADVVTVYSCDVLSSVQDEPKINLSSGWSKHIKDKLTKHFEKETVSAIKNEITKRPPKNDGQLIQRLANHLDPLELQRVLAVVTISAEPHALGRVDINHATPLVLNALGVLEPDQVHQICQHRRDLDDRSMASPLWPYEQGLIRADQLGTLCNQMTTRGLAYRLVLAAGEIAIDDPDSQIVQPRIFEVVVDLVDPSPRVAYLRDVSLLQTAARLTHQDLELESAPLLGVDLYEPAYEVAGAPEEAFISATEAASSSGVTAFPARRSVPLEPEPSLDPAMAEADPEPQPAGAQEGRIGRWRVVR